MKNFLRDFISEENRQFKFKLGSLLASSLAGFVAGIAISVIFMRVALNYLG
jgi:hypothetical protein